MVAPDHAIKKLTGDIKTGSIKDLEEVSSRLIQIHDLYETYTWAWTTSLLSEFYGIKTSKIGSRQLLELVITWESEFIKLVNLILKDARKEYDKQSRIGYGIDGNDEIANRDFDEVRGIPEKNSFFVGLQKEMEQIIDRAGNLKRILSKI